MPLLDKNRLKRFILDKSGKIYKMDILLAQIIWTDEIKHMECVNQNNKL